MLLKGATHRLLLQRPSILSVPREGYTIDDNYISIINFIKNNSVIKIKDAYHIKKLIQDKNIKKIYFSDEIIEEFNYLPFIQLGIEFLLEHCEFEDAQQGQTILEKHIRNADRKRLKCR